MRGCVRVGGFCVGFVGICLGRLGKFYRRGDIELRKGRGSLSGGFGGKDILDRGIVRAGVKRFGSIGFV